MPSYQQLRFVGLPSGKTATQHSYHRVPLPGNTGMAHGSTYKGMVLESQPA